MGTTILHRRLLGGAIATLALAIMLLGAVSPALALNTATWSGASPAAGAVVLIKPTAPVVVADDTAPITKATVTMNGYPASFVNVDFYVGHSYYDEEAESDVWMVDDWTVARITGYFSPSQIVSGTNTIVTTVTSSKGVSTYTRTFTYGSVTTISVVTPAADSVLPASPSDITVTLSSGATSFSSVMSLDGVVVPTTYTAATKTFKHTPSAALSAGQHTVAFTAIDSSGGSVSRTWKFKVSPPMSDASECSACHVGYPAAHPVADCSDCHTHGYVNQGGTHGNETPTAAGCSGDGGGQQDDACHRLDHSNDPQWGVWGSGPFDCADCHSATYPDVPQHTDAETASAHVSASTGCEPCHSASLVTEHAKYPKTATIKYQCTLCHGTGASAQVKAAVAAGNTACSGCHAFSSGHEALHITTVDAACAGCHTGTSLTSLHINSETELTCDSCHESADTRVVAAIAAGDKRCSACHDAQPHPNLAAAHAATNMGSGDIVMGLNDGDHNGKVVTEDCGRCHYTDLSTQHAGQCQICHVGAGAPSAPGGTWNKSCQQGACHPSIHAGTLTTDDHFGAYWNSSSSCDVCHDGGDPWPGSGDNCEACHSAAGTIPDDLAPTTTSNAVSAYTGLATIALAATDAGGSGVSATYYKVDFGAWQAGTTVLVAAPSSGTAIHTLQFYSADVAGNNETPKSATFTVAGPGPADTTGPVGTMTVSNDAAYVNTSNMFVTASMSDAGTGLYGQSIDPGTGTYGAWGPYSASQNIALPTPDGLKTVRVQYKDYAGNITIKTDTVTRDTAGPVTNSGATNGASYYGSQSFMVTASDALSGVNRTYVQIDGGAYALWTLGTPVSVTAPASGAAGHTIRCYSYDNATNIGAVHTASFVVYASADTVAPSGTMSINNGASATNLTAATVNSAVTDTGSGMSQMRVDQNGTGAYGSWFAYTASYAITLPIGNGTKTVNVQYRDVAGNVLTRSDTIVFDATAPTGTMSINNGAADTNVVAVTVNSAMTDSPSGLFQMRIDPGTGAYGAWTAYAASSPITLPAGGGLKTVNVQYTDNAGNTATLTDTINLVVAPPDTTPPVTTSSAVDGQVYTGDQTFTLSATDAGSGVASTWYKLDTGAWTLGTSVFVGAPALGSASHTLLWYSIDVATNQEAGHSAEFSVQAPPLGTASFGFTGADQIFVVPAGVSMLTVDLYGGEGGEFDTWPGGLGGGVHALVPVTPGQVLTVRVGGCPGADNPTGGWPNGGSAGHGGAGGGSTSILSGSAIWLEAGAGGGGDHNDSEGGPGGAEGWLPGGGQFGGSADGAAGGGGWNGGAGYGTHDGGGEGGTSYIALGTGTLSQGVNAGDGSVTFSW